MGRMKKDTVRFVISEKDFFDAIMQDGAWVDLIKFKFTSF